MKNRFEAASLAAVLFVGLAGTAQAAPIVISGSGTLGSFTGTLDYSASGSTAATLTIGLTNTSVPANGGFITAFVLNNPDNRITSISSFANGPGGGTFGLLALDNNNVSGAPNGQFDFGASTGGSFQGGGAPGPGVGVGVSDSFTFSLSGTALNTITSATFLSTLSAGPGDGEGPASFVVRFRGFGNGGSDKVVGDLTGNPPAETNVPEPASIALLGVGLLGIGAIRRRWL